MPAAIRALDEVTRRSSGVRRKVGDELRSARIMAGLSQRAVGAAVGCSAAAISRVERGLVPDLTVRFAMRHAAVVGLAFRVDLYPAGQPIRDAGQLRVLGRLEPHVRPPFVWKLEMPIGRGDLRAFDAIAVMPGCRIGFDVWSRVHDVQAQVRRSQRKRADSGVERLILVFGDTWANRRAVRGTGEPVRRAFPLSSRQVLGALRAGRDPGGDGIVFI